MNANKLLLNYSRTKYLLIKPLGMKTIEPDDFKVNVRGINIDRCFSTKYLGVVLDENLSWKSHIKYLQNKLSQSVGILAKMRKYRDNTNLITLYYSFFFSHILYGILGWGSVTKSESLFCKYLICDFQLRFSSNLYKFFKI